MYHDQPKEVGNSEQQDKPVNTEQAEVVNVEQAEAVNVEQAERDGVDEQVPHDEAARIEEGDHDGEEGYKDGEEDEGDLYHHDKYKYGDGEEDDYDEDDYDEEREDIMHKDDSEDILHKSNKDEHNGEEVIMDHTADYAPGSLGHEEMASDQQKPPSGNHGNQVDGVHADKPPPEDKLHTEGDIPNIDDGDYPIDDGAGNIREFPEDKEEDPRVFEEIAKRLAAGGNSDLEWEELYEKQLNHHHQIPDDQDQRQDHQANNQDDGTLGHPFLKNNQDMPGHQDRSDQWETLDQERQGNQEKQVDEERQVNQERQIDQEASDQSSKSDYQINNQGALEYEEIPVHERLHNHRRPDDQVRPDGLADHENLDVHNQQERLASQERPDMHGGPEDHNRPDQQDQQNEPDYPDYQDRPEDNVTQFLSHTTSDVESSLITEHVTSSVDQSEHVVSVTATPVTMEAVTTTPVTMEEGIPIIEEPTDGGLKLDEQHDNLSNDRVVEEEMKKDDELPRHDYEIPNYRDEIEKHNKLHGEDIPTEPGRRDKYEQNGGQNYEGWHTETTTMEEGDKRDIERDGLNSEQQKDEDFHRDEKDEKEVSETPETVKETGGGDLEMHKSGGAENDLEVQEKYEDGREKDVEIHDRPEGDTDLLKDIHTTSLPHQQYQEDVNTADPQYGHPAYPEHDTQDPHYSEGFDASPDVSEHMVMPSVTMTTVTHDEHTDQPTVEMYSKPHATHLPSDDDATAHHHDDDVTSHHHDDNNDDDVPGMYYDVCYLMCYYDNRTPWLAARHTSSIPTSWSS